MDTTDTNTTTMKATGIDLTTHEQEAYLRYLITTLGDPGSRHERLTAKAYQAILGCLEADAQSKTEESGND